MSKGFSENKRRFLRELLIERGKTLFTHYGFKKTSIHELTSKVGIGQGTFYNFFDSIEKLYFAILELEEVRIKKQLDKVDIFKDGETKKAIKRELNNLNAEAETNPLIR